MKRGLIILFSGFLMFLVSFVWAADSKLVEASKREKARRAKIKAENVRVLTNRDIEEFKKKNETPGSAESETVLGEQEQETTTDTTGIEESGESGVDAEEAKWRKKYEDAAKRVEKAQQDVTDLQNQFNAASNAYFNNSGPGTLDLWNELNELNGEIDNAKKEAARAEQGMEELQDEARREVVPPGWVRE